MTTKSSTKANTNSVPQEHLGWYVRRAVGGRSFYAFKVGAGRVTADTLDALLELVRERVQGQEVA